MGAAGAGVDGGDDVEEGGATSWGPERLNQANWATESDAEE
jgi:hypothetical protein